MDYSQLVKRCKTTSTIISTLVEGKMLPYAYPAERLDREIKPGLHRFRHIFQQIPSLESMATAQYVAYRLFRKDGFITRYIHHSEFKNISDKEKNWMELTIRHPWRFSFSTIVENPHQDFYLMEDAFSGEEYLLYSPAVSKILKEKTSSLWFNLIGYNGECWQTYGTVSGYKGFEPEDIRFYANFLNPEVYEDREIMEDVARNPFPYMMLIFRSETPIIEGQGFKPVFCFSEFEVESAPPRSFEKYFTIEYNSGVYKYSLKGWEEFPHYACFYFDEKEITVLQFAMTFSGFMALYETLDKHQFDVDDFPAFIVNPGFIVAMEKILKKKIELDPYEHLFDTTNHDPKTDDQLARINTHLADIFEDINAGKTPDIEEFSAKTGIDRETAKEIVDDILKKLGR